MLRLTDVVRQHGPAYLERHRSSIMPSHVAAVQAILRCRTPAMGGHLAACEQCGTEHLLFHSCRNRACPQCGYDATTKWLERQRALLLPVPYFQVVFTLPDPLRRLVRSNQKLLLPVLFQTAFESLSALCADPHFLGAAQIAALTVLHTWTRTLEWHPHLHMLVPAGGLAPDGKTWLSVPVRKKRFIVPVAALAVGFRGRFLDRVRQLLPSASLPQKLWDTRWVVFAKPALQGPDKLLDYLGRYVHKTALSDHAILACDQSTVTFRYRDNRTQQRKAMTLDANEFMRRLLQHVPPKGFHRIRSFGLLHAAHRHTLLRLQLMLAPPPTVKPEASTSPPRPKMRCRTCQKGTLVLGPRLSAPACIAFMAALELRATNGARAPP